MVRTPAFDRIAQQGLLFLHAFNSAPACAPSRAAMLTGRNFWELDEAAIHFSFFPARHTTVTDLLRENGYAVGYTGKGWAPGLWQEHRQTDPSGTPYQSEQYENVPQGISHNHYAANFARFYQEKGDKPFFFMLGTTEPHRDLAKGMGLKAGKRTEEVVVPEFLPDTEAVRSDLLDYYYEIEWYDRQIAEVLSFLEANGELENTLLIATSDNGMAFPRAKSNLYDYGSRLPLAIAWPGMKSKGRKATDFVNLKDLAPTILEFAGLKVPAQMNGRSLMPLLLSPAEGRIDPSRDHVVMGKELHAWCHPNGQINPVRAIRTDRYLYIRNLRPDLWPAGDPDPQYAWDLRPFGDVDNGPSKDEMIRLAVQPEGEHLFRLAFGKRPPEELYDVNEDPYQLQNLAYKPGYQEVKERLDQQLTEYLMATNDPRTLGRPEVFDQAPYFWSHGLETAGLPPHLWESLSEEEKMFKTDSVKTELLTRNLQ